MNQKLKNKKGITLIALVVTIVVLLILAGVSINLVLDNNGIIQKGKDAKSATIIADEKGTVEMSYASAKINKLGDTITAEELQEELDASVGIGKTVVTSNGDGTLNVLFNATGNNYSVDNGAVEKIEIDNTKMAMFDKGENVAIKMHALAKDGEIIVNDNSTFGANISINAIKRYKGTPDLTKMTDENIVSWTEGYTLYEQNPDAYKGIVSEGTKLCPIYMWFEESEEEIRDVYGRKGLTEITDSNTQKKVKTGILYWWSESNSVYLNFDSSEMFAKMPYLTDISGLSGVKTDYVTNMSRMFFWSTQNLINVNALKNWNTSNVEDMSSLFYAWYGDLSDISGLKNWNTAKVTDMSSMFIGCKLEDAEALRNWNTSNVTDMSHMFGDGDETSGLKSLDAVSSWDVSKVTNMEGMFYTCSITDLSAISKWNVSNVTSVSGMFLGNPIADASGINNWDITNVTNFNSMFSGCSTHPEFTKVTGTWDSDGTFTPTTE